jgi:methylated-DNA-[protein]-cysteine S-methyltransferase
VVAEACRAKRPCPAWPGPLLRPADTSLEALLITIAQRGDIDTIRGASKESHVTSADLTAACPVADTDLNQLRARLTTAVVSRGVLDVAYRIIDTPIGELLLAATPAGLVRVAFASEGLDGVLQQLADRISPRVLPAPARLGTVARQVDQYFAGQREGFDIPLDWQLASGFRRTVLARLSAEVAYGHITSYSALAALAGSPRAVRAAGTACATNPIPVIVPCHRVIRLDGSAGGYRGGPEAKRILLGLESAA